MAFVCSYVGMFYVILPTFSIFFVTSKSNFLYRQSLTRVRIRMDPPWFGWAPWIRIRIETSADPKLWQDRGYEFRDPKK
jgi:hypothetical protein